MAVNITHQFRGDLEVTLVHPDGTAVRLHNGGGGETDDLVASYPDATLPVEGLAALFGKPVAGSWRVRVRDRTAGDTGVFNSASLTVTTTDGTGVQATTGADGHYTLPGLPPGSYRVTPDLAGETFAPSFREVSLVNDVNGIDFTVKPTFRVSGRVTSNGAGLAGVRISAGAATAVTGADGTYALAGLAGGVYRVTPTRLGYVFTPRDTTVSVGPNTSGVDFAAREVPVNAAVFRLSDAVAAAGGSVSLDLGFTANGARVTAANFDLVFDPTRLQFLGATRAGLPPGVELLITPVQDGRVRVLMGGLTNSIPFPDGNLVDITMRATPASGGERIDLRITQPGTNTEGVLAADGAAFAPAAAISSSVDVSAAAHPPKAPVNLTIDEVSSSRVRLSWAGRGGENGFLVERAEGTGAFRLLKSVGDTSTTYEDTEVVPEITYRYQVQAFSVGGEFGFTNIVQATTPPGPLLLGGKLVLAPAEVRFKVTRIGKTGKARLKLQNRGTGPLVITAAAPVGPFHLRNGLGQLVLLPKKKGTLQMEFVPGTAGPFNAELLLVTSDVTKRQVRVPLSGTGR